MPANDDLPTRTLADSPSGGRLVVAFCAAWCNTCDDFRKTFDSLAATRRGMRFRWLDIEDDADLVGDIDIENFPTVAVFDDDRLLHFGVSLPQRAIVARLLDSLDASSCAITGHEAVTGLPQRLDAARPGLIA